jgi:hypothetical protein
MSAVALAVVLIAWRGNVFIGVLAAAVLVGFPRCHGSLNQAGKRGAREDRSGSTLIDRRIRG